MTLDEAIKHAEEEHRQLAEWLRDYKRLKEQEPCEEVISREDTLKAMIEQLGIRNEDYLLPAEATLYKVVKNMPPVTPQQNIGRWIFVDKAKEHARCSECGYGNVDLFDGRLHNYCERCGAKMQESEEVQPKQTDFNEKMIDAIDFAIKATDSQDDYSMGMRNGMRYVKSLIDGKQPQYESRQTDEEIKLGIDLGDEVVDDFGAKGVVVGIDTYEGEVWLSLLMRNHKVPQLVQASNYKTKTGKHFLQIVEVLEQIKGETDEK